MKYLLEIHHGIGDVIQYTGLIKSVRSYDKGAFISVVVNKEAYKALFVLDENIDKIFVVDFSGKKPDLMRTIRKIRKENFDYMVCSPHSRQNSMEFMALTFGARIVVGSKLNRLSKISRRFILANVNISDHVVRKNNQVLLALNPKFNTYQPYLICPDSPVEVKKHSIGLCIGTSSPQKTWPIERYIEIGEFFENQGHNIVLLGGKKEQEEYERSGYGNGAWQNLLGKTNLIESASVCAECELIIGGDTGLMHMAAAVGTTTLTLFSASNPMLHAPYSEKSYCYHVSVPCQYCLNSHRVKNCCDYKCIKGITAQKVKEIAEDILKQPEKAEKYRLELRANSD